MKTLKSIIAILSMILLATGTLAQSGKSTSAAPNITGEQWDGLFINVSTGNKFARCFRWVRQDGNKVFGELVTGRGTTCNPKYTYKIEGSLKRLDAAWWVIIPELLTPRAVQSMRLEIRDTKIRGQETYSFSWGKVEGRLDLKRKR